MPGIDSNTQLILHCDGADGSTTFSDSSLTPKTVTANGTAQVDTAQSVFGGASYLGDGATSFLSSADNAAYELGSANFTLECWARFATNATSMMWIAKYTTAGNQRSWYWGWDGSANMDFRYSTNGTATTLLSFTWSPSTAQWYHLAMVRNGGNLTGYVDGTSLGTNAISGTLFDGSATLNVGAFNAGSGGWHDGWLDEVRLSNTARWTANFTPPTDAYAVATIASPFLSERRTPRRRMIQRI